MTIKKIKPVKPAGASAAAPAPATGSATIADRFKLDVPETSAKKGGTVGKKPAMIALGVGVLALVVAGVLALVLYQHWDYLCNQVV